MDEILGEISGTQIGALGVLLLFMDREAQARKTDLIIKQIHGRLNFIQMQIMKSLRKRKK